jgi:hypothetical protein
MGKYTKWNGWKKDKNEDNEALESFIDSGGAIVELSATKSNPSKKDDSSVSLAAEVAGLISSIKIKS